MSENPQRIIPELFSEIAVLKRKARELEDDLASARTSYFDTMCDAEKYAKQAASLQRICNKYRKSRNILSVISVALLIFSLFALSGIRDAEKQLNPSSHPSTGLFYDSCPECGFRHYSDIEITYPAFALGYDAALHGVNPDPQKLVCFSCGYSGFEYPDYLQTFDFSGVYVPLCTNCISTATENSPVTIMGEDYYFSPADYGPCNSEPTVDNSTDYANECNSSESSTGANSSLEHYKSNFMRSGQHLEVETNPATHPVSPSPMRSPTDQTFPNNNSSSNVYIGNANTMKFHLPSCSYLPDVSNQVPLPSWSDALAQGYEPCERCDP